jgi:ankyrin repeat protein
MGMTPLHVACRRGNPRCIAVLLAAGADPHVQSAVRMTPLLYAVQSGNDDAIAAVCAVYNSEQPSEQPDTAAAAAAAAPKSRRARAKKLFANFADLWRAVVHGRQQQGARPATINTDLLRAQGPRDLARLLTHAITMGHAQFASTILSCGAEGLPSLRDGGICEFFFFFFFEC